MKDRGLFLIAGIFLLASCKSTQSPVSSQAIPTMIFQGIPTESPDAAQSSPETLLDTPELQPIIPNETSKEFEDAGEMWGEIYVTFRTTKPPFIYQLGYLPADCLLPERQGPCSPLELIPAFPGKFNGTLQWSPNGSRAVMSYLPQLLTFDPQALTFTSLVDSLHIASLLYWAPNGQWIIVPLSDHEPYRNVMALINAENGEVREINPGLPGVYRPIGWRNTEEVLFLLEEYEPGAGGDTNKQFIKTARLYSLNIQNDQLIELGENKNWAAYPPAISQDGASLAFITEDIAHPPLFVMNSDGTDIRELGTFGVEPIWSSDDNWIASFSVAEALSSTTMYLVHPDGTDGHEVFTETGAFPTGLWLPDNQHLLITTYNDDNDVKFLYLISIQDGSVQPVTIPGLDQSQYVVQGISLRPLSPVP